MMRTGFLLIAISIIALLFTSCEKDEMGVGGGTGGGMQNDNSVKSAISSPKDSLTILVTDVTLDEEQP